MSLEILVFFWVLVIILEKIKFFFLIVGGFLVFIFLEILGCG